MKRGIVIATEFGKSLESLSLGIIEFGWNLHLELHVEISLGMTLETRHPVPLDPEITSSLRSRRDFHLHGSRKSRHFDLATQCGSDKRNRHPTMKVGSISREDRMLLKVDHDIEVTGTAAPSSSSTSSSTKVVSTSTPTPTIYYR